MTLATIKKIALLTSGGDAPGLNACVRAVVRSCVFHHIKVIGIHRGFEGMIDGDSKLQLMDILSSGNT